MGIGGQVAVGVMGEVGGGAVGGDLFVLVQVVGCVKRGCRIEGWGIERRSRGGQGCPAAEVVVQIRVGRDGPAL